MKTRLVWLAVFVIFPLVTLDLWSKHWISTHFGLHQTKSIVPGLVNLTLVHNRGAAFGMGSEWSVPFFLIASGLAIGLVLTLYFRSPPANRISRWALLMILAGAIGNLVDRVRLGYVVDFLDAHWKTHHWPAFNAADAYITVGAILYALDHLFERRRGNPSGG